MLATIGAPRRTATHRRTDKALSLAARVTAVYRIESLSVLYWDMANVRMEVRKLDGTLLHDLCGVFDDPGLPVSHAAIARWNLLLIRGAGDEEIGCWSSRREAAVSQASDRHMALS
jgi:hypothetical protein